MHFTPAFIMSILTRQFCSCRRQLTRRATSLRFTHSDDAVLIADKSGDAYSFSTASPGEDGRLLLGHVSMLLDLVRAILFIFIYLIYYNCYKKKCSYLYILYLLC